MNSLQPDIPVSAKIPVIMVETVAPSSKRIAPHGAQSQIMSMLGFGRSEMPYKPKPRMPVVNEMKRRFPTVETGISAMTLTPPRASGRAAGSRLAWPLVAKPDGKPNGELNAIGRNIVAAHQTKTVKLPVIKPATAMRFEPHDAESSAMKGTEKHYEQTH
jgi:hypothetical protein